MVTVEADDLVAMSMSWCWIPQQLNGWICHHTFSQSGGRSETYETCTVLISYICMPQCGKQFQIRLLESVVPKSAAEQQNCQQFGVHDFMSGKVMRKMWQMITDDRHNRRSGHVVWSIKYMMYIDVVPLCLLSLAIRAVCVLVWCNYCSPVLKGLVL